MPKSVESPPVPRTRELARKYMSRLEQRDARFNRENARPDGQRRMLGFQRPQSQGFSRDDHKILEKIHKAMEHYIKGDPSLAHKPEALFSHMDGIDFTLPVKIIDVPKGTALSQLQLGGKGTGETRQGNYYALIQIDVESDAQLSGIANIALVKDDNSDDKGYYAAEKEHTNYFTMEDIKALMSTAKSITDTWSLKNRETGEMAALETEGGGTQLYVNKNDNQYVQPQIYLSWQKCVEDIANNASFTQDQTLEVQDILNTYAMILYNRASFDKDNLPFLLDRVIQLEDMLLGNNHPLAEEALDIMKSAAETALAAINKVGNITPDKASLLKDLLEDALTKRRAEVARAPTLQNR